MTRVGISCRLWAASMGSTPREAEKLLELAERARLEAADLWQFTNLIKRSYSLGQKMVLLEVMWGLVYADGELSTHEESLMRKVCHLLDLAAGLPRQTFEER